MWRYHSKERIKLCHIFCINTNNQFNSYFSDLLGSSAGPSSATPCSGAYILSRLQLLVSWQELSDATTWQRNDPGLSHLRLANANVCIVPRSSTRLGDVSQDHESGTVYRALCNSLTWTLDSFNDYWRHFCLSETAMHLWLFVFWCAVYKFIYLLTYTYK